MAVCASSRRCRPAVPTHRPTTSLSSGFRDTPTFRKRQHGRRRAHGHERDWRPSRRLGKRRYDRNERGRVLDRSRRVRRWRLDRCGRSGRQRRGIDNHARWHRIEHHHPQNSQQSRGPVGRSEGRVTASTGGGDIELEDVTGDASATTGAGDVRINVVNSGRTDHSINVESGSGRVVIEVPRISTRASSWKAPTRTTSTERRASPATSRSIEAKRTVGTGARERLESTFARMASSGTVAD